MGTKVVILAAGRGTRMKPLTNEKPKGLLELNRESIIERQIRILRSLGIKEENIAIVIGYKSNYFRKKFSDSSIKFIENNDFDSTDNLYSFKLTKDFGIGNNLLVINGDVIFTQGLIEKTLNQEGSAYPLDMEKRDDESIKARVEDGRLVEILGKEKEVYDGVTTEVFKISKGDSIKLFEAADEISNKDKTQWFDYAVDKILDDCYFAAVDVSNVFWREVDTPNEIQKVRKRLKKVF